MAADCAMLPGAHAMTVVAALAKCYRAGPRMLGHPWCRFLPFAIVPNCGGSGEKRLSCFTEHALAFAEKECFTAASRSSAVALARATSARLFSRRRRRAGAAAGGRARSALMLPSGTDSPR